jgi:hypothetical protein
LRLGVSAVRHDMKREETVEEVEKNTELERQTPKRNVVRSSRAGGANDKRCKRYACSVFCIHLCCLAAKTPVTGPVAECRFSSHSRLSSRFPEHRCLQGG